MINLSDDEAKEKEDDNLLRLVDYINEHLEEVVLDVIVVTAAYIQNGCPIVDKEILYPFGEWNKYCRWPWIWVTGDEPVPRLVRVRNLKKKNANAVERICQILSELSGDVGVKSCDIIEFINDEKFSDNARYLSDYFKLNRIDLNSECVGKYLASLCKLSVSGYAFDVGRKDNTNVYFIEKMRNE